MSKENCGCEGSEAIQFTLCVVGDKWTALILHMLEQEPRRFKDFREEIASLNPRTLTQRLTKLTDQGIITKDQINEESCTKYSLTDKGRDLDKVISDMAAWGKKHQPKGTRR